MDAYGLLQFRNVFTIVASQSILEVRIYAVSPIGCVKVNGGVYAKTALVNLLVR